MENYLPTHIQCCDRGILVLCWTWIIVWCTPICDIHDIMKDDQSGCSGLYRNDCHICLDSRTYLTYYWWLWRFSANFYKPNIVFCLCHLQLSRSVYSNSTELLLVLFVCILFYFLVRIACETRTVFSPNLSYLVSNLHPSVSHLLPGAELPSWKFSSSQRPLSISPDPGRRLSSFDLHLANFLFNVILPSILGSSFWSFG
jgi:hypothetical protein